MTDMPLSLVDVLKKLVFGTGAGIGVMVAYTAYDAIHAKPELALQVAGQIMTGSGALIVVLLLGMYFANQRVGEGLQVLRDNTVAQRDLADAVKTLADKDDREAEKQRLTMSYIARQQDKILEEFEAFKHHKARGAGA